MCVTKLFATIVFQIGKDLIVLMAGQISVEVVTPIAAVVV